MGRRKTRLPVFCFMKRSFLTIVTLILLCSCVKNVEQPVNAILSSIEFCGEPIALSFSPTLAPVEGLTVDFTFTKALDISRFDRNKLLVSGAGEEDFSFSVDASAPKVLHVAATRPLPAFSQVTIKLAAGENLGVNLMDDLVFSFTTEYDPSDKFGRIPADELFEKVQKAAFSYFWDYAHPTSGLARERLNSGNTVTTGGSGFGVMTIPVGIERGWITRSEGAERTLRIVDFLYDKAERFHGAWAHWIDGASGKTIAFSDYDDGADLVETAFMIQGLLAVSHYFTGSDAVETAIRSKIRSIWEGVEWTWFLQDGQDRLYWHWSPVHGWKMNMPISGWNEALIVYVLAAGSPTYPISREVYENGWARGGGIRNGKTFQGVTLPLGQDLGGPMFFAHYSFMGLDPRHLKDQYADYWEQNRAHALINHHYCARSKKGYGYSDACWGLTASDYSKGYAASSPTRDLGTIAPTAALASFPYVPEQAQAAMEYFYYKVGDRLWGEYGFRDAFSFKDGWFAKSYIAIDEGPIVVMMENHRTGLLWDCFMQDEDVRRGLTALGFTWE